MFYALWDLESGSSLGDYDSEAEALAVVRDLLDANTPDYAEMLSLDCTDDAGTKIIAAGLDLARLASLDPGSSRRSV